MTHHGKGSFQGKGSFISKKKGEKTVTRKFAATVGGKAPPRPEQGKKKEVAKREKDVQSRLRKGEPTIMGKV